MKTKIFLLIIFCFANFLNARGGGGCFKYDTRINTPYGEKEINKLKPGDEVISEENGNKKLSYVRETYSIETSDFIEIEACSKKVEVTANHPFMISEGVFKEAGKLNIGDMVYLNYKDKIGKCEIKKIAVKKEKALAYNLLVYPYGKYIANGIIVHNKGCFLPDTFILKSDNSKVKLSDIKEGDELLSFDEKGNILKSKVREIIKLRTNEYFELKTENITLKATREHPFYVGDGIFKTLESLKVGDYIYYYNGSSVSKTKIISIEKKNEDVDIYNLRVDKPNTFFANFIAVHNKGGGCFPAGTLIASKNGFSRIEDIKAGDSVLAYAQGKIVSVKVKAAYEKLDKVFTLFTEKGVLRTTAEHPFLGEDGFKKAEEFKPGEKIAFYENEKVSMISVRGWAQSQALEKVYNLSVEAPNTFIASGFIAHNKGGGGFSGGGFHGSRYYGRYKNEETDSKTYFALLFIIALISIVNYRVNKGSDEELDYLFSRSDIMIKSKKTEKLLSFISKQDKNLEIEYLKKLVSETFLKLQKCWQNRDYSEMKPLIMEHLYNQHLSQLEIMKSEHEINVIENLELLDVDIVWVKYTHNPEERFFTALITAQAKDYYIDDRNDQFIRGDKEINKFQEFWTFRFFNSAWLLTLIEQTAESDVLSREDFVEQFTDDTMSNIYGEDISKVGQSGPWANAEAVGKENKIERMINFLYLSDKMWDMAKMEVNVSLAFIKVYEAWSKLDSALLPQPLMTPEFYEELSKLIKEKKENGFSFEFKNMCVRKVEIILVNNKTNNSEDEFVARISAHARRKMIKDNLVINDDSYVVPFTEYWSFTKGEKNWVLKEILPRSIGEKSIRMENKDEESSPMQLEWYYTKKRPY